VDRLNLGAVHKRRQERPLLFALAFAKGSDNREATFKRLNGNNPATSYMYKYRELPFNNLGVYTLLKRAIFAAIRLQFDDRSSFGTLAFRQ